MSHTLYIFTIILIIFTNSVFTITYFVSDNDRERAGYSSSIVSLNATTGARSLISTNNNPGLAFRIPLGMLLYDYRSLLTVDCVTNTLFKISLGTGTRIEVSGNSVGSGIPFSCPVQLVFSPTTSNNVLVTSIYNGYVVRVSLNNGIRSIFSGGAVGTGPAMTGPSGIAYDSQGSKLYVSDSSLNIFQIDPLNGNRVVISSPSLGDGPDLEGPFLLLSYISSTNSLIVSSTNSTIGGDIYSVDIETGDRAIISQGDGPEVETPWETIYEKNTDSILVCDITGLQIVRLDLQSLYKTVISNNSSPSDSLLLGPVGLSSCGEADFSGVASGCTCKTSALFTEGKCECYHNGAYDLDDGCSCPIGNDDAAYITNGEPGCMCIPLGVSQRSYEAGVGCICLSDAVYDSNNYQCRCSGGSNRGTYVKYKGCSCPAAGGVYTVGVGCSCIAPATYNNVSGCTCPGGGAYSTSDGCNCVAPSVPSADGCSCPADSDAFYTSTGCTCPGTAVYSETEGCHCDGGSGVYVKGTGCTCPPNNGATHVKGFGCQCTSPGKYITGAGCTCDGDPSKYTPQKGCKIDASSHIGESSGACLPISTSIVVSFFK